jgi:hypothetical protein
MELQEWYKAGYQDGYTDNDQYENAWAHAGTPLPIQEEEAWERGYRDGSTARRDGQAPAYGIAR